MAKTVVIVGAGWAGLPLAHKLLKYTVPKAPNLKVILVSQSTHFFWNVAATRGIMPGEIPTQDLFIPIEPAFRKYNAKNFEFVVGTAEGIEDTDNAIIVAASTPDGARRRIQFDHLVVATGSKLASNLPLKLQGSYDETIASWNEIQDQIKKSKTIAISGGGPTGIEVAGELAAKYRGEKTITLIMSHEKPIPEASPSVRATAKGDLRTLGVRIVAETKALGAISDPDTGKTTIQTSNGTTITTEVYLPLHGVTVNTSWLPSSLLDTSGNLNLGSDMRASGTTNIWGIGDVGNLEPKQLTVTDNQIIYLASALDAVLTGNKEVESYKPANKTMLFVSLGRKHATGQIGNWRLLGFMVNYVKGRRLFVDTAKGYVNGEYLRHAKM